MYIFSRPFMVFSENSLASMLRPSLSVNQGAMNKNRGGVNGRGFAWRPYPVAACKGMPAAQD
ncbi:MAG: hypothetical protein QGI42_04235 [Rhodospirillales bacterium]|nr:hypothetical protein [Rhodospirillales bacterium]